MMSVRPLAASIFVVGANHRSSSMAMRDRLMVNEHDMPEVLAALPDGGVDQAMMLCTCDRVDVVAIAADSARAASHVIDTLSGIAEVTRSELEPQLYVHHGDDAIRHLFAVCSALDSMVVGDPQVFSQVRASHRASRTAGMCRAELETLLEAAYRCAQRVKGETDVPGRPVSLAAAAVEVLARMHGDAASCRVLLSGVGDFGVLIVEAMREAGVRELCVTHPRSARADMMARALSCHMVDYASLMTTFPSFDVVVAALGKQDHSITKAMVRSALKARRNRPVLLYDVAIPGDVEPGVEELSDAFVWTLDELEELARVGQTARVADAIDAYRIVDAEADRFLEGDMERAATPLIGALREHFEEARLAVLAECGDDAEQATRLLVNRLLQAPTQALKAMGYGTPAAGSDLTEAQRVLAALFALGAVEKDKRE